MKKVTTVVACICMAFLATTAFADVAGSNPSTTTWTSTGTYSSTISLTDPGGNTTITDVTVGLNIDHSWSSDISMTLTGPGGTVEFIDNEGDSDDYSSSSEGEYLFNDSGIAFPNMNPIPASSVIGTSNSLLATFGGTSSDGVWTLVVSDTTGGDGGTIGGWSISLTTIPEPASATMLSLAGLLGFMLVRKR